MTLHPSMPLDADTLSFSLTYGGTLVVALLMFIGQLTTVGILLVAAGIIRLPAYPIQGHLAIIQQIWPAMRMVVAITPSLRAPARAGLPYPPRSATI
jgi:hypothetical protein